MEFKEGSEDEYKYLQKLIFKYCAIRNVCLCD
jgi:hypothetical protein